MILKTFFPLGALLTLATAAAYGQTPAPDLASNPAPVIKPLDPKLPTLFVAGDSTGTTSTGWGAPFAALFDPEKINVANRSRGGTSSRTFITSGYWDNLLAEAKSGDLILIQLGTNDGGPINDEPPPPLRARGTLPGLGEETREIDNAVTKKHEVVHTYGWYLRKMVGDAKAKGAKPILCSLTVRNIWHDGRVERNERPYGSWAYNIAVAEHVPFIDVGNKAADEFEKLGAEKMAAFYPKDHTHFIGGGAELHAAVIVAGLKGLRLAALSDAYSEKGAAVAADREAWLRLPTPANPKLPSLFLVGDSTVRNGEDDGQGKGPEGQWGWGNPIAAYFDAAKINVVNRAIGGLSSRTYYTGPWPRVRAMIRPGDFVIMQLGTNDGAPLNDSARARGTIKGVGDESETIENQLTKKTEVVHTYGWYLRQIIAETRAQGGTPIVCSLIPRKSWDDSGHIKRAKADYAGWAEQVAKQENAPFIDLNELVAHKHDELGHDAVMQLFPQVTPDEHTHPNWAGAELNAQLVIGGLKALKEKPLDPFLSEKSAAIAPTSPQSAPP